MSNERYYIGTGAKNCFYTLRYAFEEIGKTHVGDGNYETFVIYLDYHVRNLSINREEAIAKAREITGWRMDTSLEVLPIDRRDHIDWSVLQSGKHEGKSIHELRETEEGKAYLCWLAENCAGNRSYAKTVELLKSLLAAELAQRADDRSAAAEKAAKEASEAAARYEEVAAVIGGQSSQKDDFCDSIASTLRRGELPRGRGLSIAIDIYAKAFGRRNSKAYCAAYERAEASLK